MRRLPPAESWSARPRRHHQLAGSMIAANGRRRRMSFALAAAGGKSPPVSLAEGGLVAGDSRQRSVPAGSSLCLRALESGSTGCATTAVGRSRRICNRRQLAAAPSASRKCARARGHKSKIASLPVAQLVAFGVVAQ